MSKSNCQYCDAEISLEGDFSANTCTDFDPTKPCKEELRKRAKANRQREIEKTRGRCEWDDCQHEWALRGDKQSYCPKCHRTPPRVGGRGMKGTKAPIPGEYPYCHQCGAPKPITRQSCSMCLQMAPTASRRFGLSTSKWVQFLVTLSRAAKTSPGLENILLAIGNEMKEDPASRVLEELLIELGSPPPTATIIGEETEPISEPGPESESDPGPDEVELAPNEALKLFKSRKLIWKAPTPEIGPSAIA